LREGGVEVLSNGIGGKILKGVEEKSENEKGNNVKEKVKRGK
jgi:hypothetical protein